MPSFQEMLFRNFRLMESSPITDDEFDVSKPLPVRDQVAVMRQRQPVVAGTTIPMPPALSGNSGSVFLANPFQPQQFQPLVPFNQQRIVRDSIASSILGSMLKQLIGDITGPIRPMRGM